jgi:hypothetical protein
MIRATTHKATLILIFILFLPNYSSLLWLVVILVLLVFALPCDCGWCTMLALVCPSTPLDHPSLAQAFSST